MVDRTRHQFAGDCCVTVPYARDIRSTLARFRDAIRKVEMDAEARTSARQLDSDINDFLDADDAGVEADSLLKRTTELEAKLSKKYPTAARIVEELLEAVAKSVS